jgi:hypothetical protein
MSSFDFNTAGEQKSFDLIPDRTVVTLHMTVRPGSAGEGGWLKRSKDGGSEAIDAEFTVVDGPHAKRKLWDRILVDGTTDGHKEAADISRRKIRAMLESARGIRPDDKSDAAAQARRISSYGDLDGLRFIARVGVEPAKGNFKAKNTLLEIITPERQEWRRVEQAPPSAKPAAAPAQPAATVVPIARPTWAQ